MQAGTPSDTSFVSRHAGGKCRTSTLFDFTDPVSPHLAAARDGTIVPDDFLVSALVEEIKSALRHGSDGEGGGSLVLVETAGGVLSPAPSGSLQADAFRPIRLPVLLVGDGKLGGIGVTLSALESLRTRGYSVLGVVMIASGARALRAIFCFPVFFHPKEGGHINVYPHQLLGRTASSSSHKEMLLPRAMERMLFYPSLHSLFSISAARHERPACYK